MSYSYTWIFSRDNNTVSEFNETGSTLWELWHEAANKIETIDIAKLNGSTEDDYYANDIYEGDNSITESLQPVDVYSYTDEDWKRNPLILVDVETINSNWYGHCIVLTPKMPVAANDMLAIKLLFDSESNANKVTMVIHPSPGDKYGMVLGEYINPGSQSFAIDRGQYAIIGITQNIKNLNIQKDHGMCIDYDPANSRIKCYLEKSKLDEYVLYAENHCYGLCRIPQAETIFALTDNQTVKDSPECPDISEYFCMKNTLSFNMKKLEEHCPHQCNIRSVHANMKVNDLSGDESIDQILIQLYFQDNIIHTLDEYLVFDFNSILTAAGGSMGLFLGFSFFDFGIMMAEHFFDIMDKIYIALNKPFTFRRKQ